MRRGLYQIWITQMSDNTHDLRMLLEFSEDLFAQWIGDLRIDAGVLNVLVAQVISHVFNAAAGFEQMHGHGVAQRAH
jgi:hypothetical protein